MAHSYFNDSETPNLYGTRKAKKNFGKPAKKFNLGKVKSRSKKLRSKIKSTRTSGTLANLGKMHDRTSDPFGRR